MKIINLDLIDYQSAYQYQKQLVKDVYLEKSEEVILICRHYPIVTLGKKSKVKDLCGWQGEVIEVERGGQATYHGPSQMIAYPIINLNKRGNDIYLYLRQLEFSISETLLEFNIKSLGDPNNTGVWCDDKKIASIGIAIKRWITYHGLAINLYNDSEAFKGISPCGMSHQVMTNIESLINLKVDRACFAKILAKNLANALSKRHFSICQQDSSI